MAFDDETIDVLIGGYLSKDAAMEDYESVLDCGGYLHGAVVVTKDLEGNLEVQQTDHMVREGAAGLGAVGFAVGLFAPPLLAATAIGAVIGAGAGKLLHHRTPEKLEEQVGADHPDRWRWADRGLPPLRGREGRARRRPGPSPARSAKPRVTTCRPSRAPSPTRRPRWRLPKADVLPVARRSTAPTVRRRRPQLEGVPFAAERDADGGVERPIERACPSCTSHLDHDGVDEDRGCRSHLAGGQPNRRPVGFIAPWRR